MIRSVGYLLLVLLGSLPLAANTQAAEEISAQEFVSRASARCIADIEAGELALARATSLKVKQFAQMMVVEHEVTNRQLTELALKQKLKMSKGPTLMARAKRMILAMRGEKSFDRAYANNQVVAHKETVALFYKAANSEHGAIRAFAVEHLPQVEQQLRMSEDLAVDVGAIR